MTDRERIIEALNLSDRTKSRENDGAKIDALVWGFEDARGYHRQLGTLSDPGVTFNQVTREMQTIAGRLRMILEGRGDLALQVRRILQHEGRGRFETLDVFYRDLFGEDDDFFLYFPIEAQRRGGRMVQVTRFARMADLLGRDLEFITRRRLAGQMHMAVQAYLEDMREPGKGAGNRRASRHRYAVMMLARHFTETTGKAASSKDDSDFSKYVAAFFEANNPRRAIEATNK
ncbi:MAG: hypothetical protein ACXIU7_11460 [Roseinatronobacter sp.]